MKLGFGRGRFALGGAASRRMGWGVADQVLSSATNFLLGIVIALSVDVRSFGAYALVFVTYQLALEGSRALASLPLQIRFSASSEGAWRLASQAATGAGLVFASAVGAVMIGAGLIADDPLRVGLIVLACFMPVLLTQDILRFAFVTQGQAVRAFNMDLAWLVAFGLGIVLLRAFEATSVGWLLFAWGAGAGVGALFGFFHARLRPHPRLLRRWWAKHRDLSGRYLFELLVSAGDLLVVIYLLGVLAGLEAVADFRGADLLLSAFNVLFFAASLVGVTEGVRLLSGPRPTASLQRFCLIASIGLALIAAVLGATILLMPDSLGEHLLGDVWYASEPVVLPLAVRLVALGAFAGALIGLRSLAAANRSLRARVLTTCVAFPLGLVGIVADGARGAATGLAIAAWIGVAVTWRELHAEIRARRTTSDG